MAFPLLFVLVLIVFSTFLYILFMLLTKDNNNNKKLHYLPPSPPKLPIIGNLHQLGKLPHRSLRSLSHRYGDLMLLYFGNRPTFVVSSMKAAEEIMKTREHVFLNRPKQRFIDRLFYGANDVGFSSYGEQWRYLKSICVTQLLSNKKVRSFRSIREEEVACLIHEIKSYNSSSFNLSEMSSILFKGIICRTALGRKYRGGHDNESGKDIYKMFKELAAVMGEVSVGDYIPYFSWIDRLSGLENRVENVHRQFDVLLEDIVQEHESRMNASKGCITDEKDDVGKNNVQDFVEVLLEIQRENPEKLSRESIKGVLLDILGAGTDTSTTMLGWATTELMLGC